MKSKIIRDGGKLTLNADRRITGCYSYVSAHDRRKLSAEQAAGLFQKLRPFLRKQQSWGMYLPRKSGEKDHALDSWPLAYRRKEDNHWPSPVTWSPKGPGRGLRFEEFLLAYNIELMEGKP